MKSLLIISIILLSSCISIKNENKINNNFNFSNNMTLDEFESKLEKYSKENPYPNIDN